MFRFLTETVEEAPKLTLEEVVGNVVNWYKLEKISPSSPSLRGTMVSSSDDDPNQESFLEGIAVILDVHTPLELYNKLESLR